MIETINNRIMSHLTEGDISLYCYLPAGTQARLEYQGIMYDEDGNETEELNRRHTLPENWRLVL